MNEPKNEDGRVDSMLRRGAIELRPVDSNPNNRSWPTVCANKKEKGQSDVERNEPLETITKLPGIKGKVKTTIVCGGGEVVHWPGIGEVRLYTSAPRIRERFIAWGVETEERQGRSPGSGN
jgi:hypothetical protein